MDLERLQFKYAPILHFAQGERFFPMAVDDWLSYSAMFVRGEAQPSVVAGQVTPSILDSVARRAGHETFIRSVDRGPLEGREVAADWSDDTLALVARWGQLRPTAWTEAMARRVYAWFNDKTAEATKRFWWNPMVLPDARGGRASLPRFRLPNVTREAALERYVDFRGGRPPLAYYYRAADQGRYLVLQYWFFYSYNDWANAFDGFNDHEGDWEGVQLFFERDGGRRVIEPPTHVCLLGHHSRMVKTWDHPELHRDGNHVHVYVAAGSHASYPEPKAYDIMTLYNLVDRATGDAYVIGHDDWRRRIDLDDASWIHTYAGSFGTRYWLSLDWLRRATRALGLRSVGEIDLPGVSAPKSPRLADDGSERETWAQSAAFAGLAE